MGSQSWTRLSDFTSLVAQLLRNPPAMRETWVQSLGWEDLEKGTASILPWRIPWTEEPVSPWGCKELDKTEQLYLTRLVIAFLPRSKHLLIL